MPALKTIDIMEYGTVRNSHNRLFGVTMLDIIKESTQSYLRKGNSRYGFTNCAGVRCATNLAR